MADRYIQDCIKLLRRLKLTIAFAESATAGWLCSEFALARHAGDTLKGGIICYDANLKHSLLGIPKSFIEKHTAESIAVTECMAANLHRLIPADVHIAVTGLTASGGSETDSKPVGTMFVAIAYCQKLHSEQWLFDGNREQIIHRCIANTAIFLQQVVEA